MRRQVLLGICLSLAAVLLASIAIQARAVTGKTLYYKATAGGQAYRTVAARTARGRVASFGFPEANVYIQYDGRDIWYCGVGEKCNVLAEGAEAKNASGSLEGNFFNPYSKNGIAGNIETNLKPSGKRTIGGVPSSCKKGQHKNGPKQVDTLCVSQRGEFLTLLVLGDQSYALKRASSRVNASFLNLPSGVWNGHFPG